MQESLKEMECNRSTLVAVMLLFVFGYLNTVARGEVRVRIQNKLECGHAVNIHCQSRDDDLGILVIPSGYEIEWSFDVNIWGTTLFYCDVEWDGRNWHHFDAYSFARDSDRCQLECLWMISQNHSLYVRNQETRDWDWVPFQDQIV